MVKNLSTLLILMSLFSSCGGIMRGLSATTQKRLIKQVAVETGCPEENIKILNKGRNFGAGTFALDVCNERKTYKQVGSVFMSDKEADNLIK